MNRYPHLFEPIQIGTKTINNRVFMPPISTNLAASVITSSENVCPRFQPAEFALQV